DVSELAVFVYDENRSRKKRDGQSFDEDAVVLAKRLIMQIRERLHGTDILGTAKTLLRKRHVEADRVTRDFIFKPGQRLLELLGLLTANAGIERRYYAK